MDKLNPTNQSETTIGCTIFGAGAFEQKWLDKLRAHLGSAAVECVDELEPLTDPERIDQRRVVLYRQDYPIREVRRLVDTVTGCDCSWPVVGVVDDGDWRAATAALREGADDYLFVDQLCSPDISAILRASYERTSVDRRSVRVQKELEERSSELLGLNALANGVSNSLDRDAIIRRGLWVFAGVCQQEAVALLEVRPLPQTLEMETTDGQEPEEHLERTAGFSVSDIDVVCQKVELDESCGRSSPTIRWWCWRGEGAERSFRGWSPSGRSTRTGR